MQMLPIVGAALRRDTVRMIKIAAKSRSYRMLTYTLDFTALSNPVSVRSLNKARDEP